MIKGFIITIADEVGIESAYRCLDSIEGTLSDISAEIYPATTPDTLEFDMDCFSTLVDYKKWPGWNWPKTPSENKLDWKTGLQKNWYKAVDQKKVMACAVSHARLWQKCVDMEEDIVILEQDSEFIRQFRYSEYEECGFGALGLNDPRGTTRNSQIFHDMVVKKTMPGAYDLPKIDDDSVPHGLAGNSAYIIRPWAAKQLLVGMNDYGLWPNDAYMCQELWHFLKVSYPFFTKVQGKPSTTTR
jgi:Glycosyltransferase family 25 (LPS biosynthesis protein)